MWRIHLSTAIVMMLLASAFLGANLYKGPEGKTLNVGFPWTYRNHNGVITRSGSFSKDVVKQMELFPGDRIDTQKMKTAGQRLRGIEWSKHWRIAGNIAVALATIAAVAALMERYLRTRSPRPDSASTMLVHKGGDHHAV